MHGDFVLGFVEVAVFHDLEADGIVDKLAALFRYLQDTVVFDILAQVAGNDGLLYDRTP